MKSRPLLALVLFFSCSKIKEDVTFTTSLNDYCREVNKYSIQCEGIGDFVIVKASAHAFQEKYLISIKSKKGYGLAQLSYLDTLYNFDSEDYLDLEKEILAINTFKIKLSSKEMDLISNQIERTQNFDSVFYKRVLDANYFYVKSPKKINIGLEGYGYQEYHNLDVLLHSLIIDPINESLVPWKSRVPKEF